ncbi:MAG: hypothetical protein ACAI38_17035, partial [Myxococcota bacterium]
MSTTPTLLAIPTGHRPEALRRALLSFTRDFAAHGHRIPVAVFHSARNAAEQDDVAKVAASSGAHYIGLGEKVALARVLRRATAVSPDLLALLLFNPERQAVSTGANRNACLLWSAGTRALHSDDDTLATLASHPEHTVDRSGHIETVAGDGCDYFVPSDGDVSRFMTAATARAPEGGVA